jgi:hypothetical protein
MVLVGEMIVKEPRLRANASVQIILDPRCRTDIEENSHFCTGQLAYFTCTEKL